MKSPRYPLRIGLFGIGLEAYWPQFEGLRERLEGYMARVAAHLERPGVELVNLGLIDSPENELFFSAASIWEVDIKSGLGRGDFKADARVLRRGLLDNGYGELPVGSEHVVAVDVLPAIHKDPFDRILVAQAQVEGITLLTVDPLVAQYPAPVRAV